MLYSRFKTFYNILVLCCLDQVLFVVFKYSNKPVTQAVCLHCFDLGDCSTSFHVIHHPLKVFCQKDLPSTCFFLGLSAFYLLSLFNVLQSARNTRAGRTGRGGSRRCRSCTPPPCSAWRSSSSCSPSPSTPPKLPPAHVLTAGHGATREEAIPTAATQTAPPPLFPHHQTHTFHVQGNRPAAAKEELRK